MKEEHHTPQVGSDRHMLGFNCCASFDGHNEWCRSWKEHLMLASRKYCPHVQMNENDDAACSSRMEER